MCYIWGLFNFLGGGRGLQVNWNLGNIWNWRGNWDWVVLKIKVSVGNSEVEAVFNLCPDLGGGWDLDYMQVRIDKGEDGVFSTYMDLDSGGVLDKVAEGIFVKEGLNTVKMAAEGVGKEKGELGYGIHI